MKKTDVKYAITWDNITNGYSSLRVDILIIKKWGSRFEKVASIRWQSNQATPLSWYAGKIETSNGDFESIEAMRECVAAVSKIVTPTTEIYDPEEIFRDLVNFERYQYDARVGEYVPLTDVLPSDFRPYLDAHDEYCTVRVMARNDDEAKHKIIKAMADDGHHAALMKWAEAGQPIKIAYRASAPNIVNIKEVLPELTM